MVPSMFTFIWGFPAFQNPHVDTAKANYISNLIFQVGFYGCRSITF